jgi:hypothetical protein
VKTSLDIANGVEDLYFLESMAAGIGPRLIVHVLSNYFRRLDDAGHSVRCICCAR